MFGEDPLLNKWHWVKGPLFNLTSGKHKLVIWNDEIDNVEATLIPPNNDIDFPDSGDDEANYSDINEGSNKTRTFKFEIEDGFEGDRITFRLEIIGG